MKALLGPIGKIGDGNILGESSISISGRSSPPGFIAMGDFNGDIFIYETGSWGLEKELNVGFNINAVSYSPENDYLAYVNAGDGLYILDTEDWNQVASFNRPQYGSELQWSPEGEYIAATAGGNASVTFAAKIYNTSDWSLETEFPKSDGEEAYAVDWASDMSLIAHSRNEKIIVRDTSDWSIVAELQENDPVDSRTASFSQDVSQLAWSDSYGSYVYDTSDWTRVESFDTPDRISFSPSGDRVITNEEVYDPSDWSTINTDGSVFYGHWSAESDYIANISGAGGITVAEWPSYERVNVSFDETARFPYADFTN